jgi:hypothetical protein
VDGELGRLLTERFVLEVNNPYIVNPLSVVKNAEGKMSLVLDLGEIS